MKWPRLTLLRPSALLIIGICFIGSGVLRVAELGPAIAEEVANIAQPTPEPEPAAALGQCPPQLEPEGLLLAIRERDEQLAEKERRLNNREQVLRVAKIRIEEQLRELEDAEARLAATVAIVDEAAENDVKRLTTVYENMKPKNAATIFETMDVNFAAGFLMRMRPDAAAAVLSNLSSEAAYSISVVMAGRNVGAPTQ